MTSDFQSGLPVNILRGIVPTATLWDGTIGYAYLDDGGVFTDDTVDANSAAAGDVPLMPAVPVLNDAFYFGEGFATSGTFNSLKITISTAGVGGTGIWEYYNGAAWVALNPTDATNGLTTAGASLQVSWTIPADMGHVAVNGQDRYWVRFRILTAYAPIATATQIWLGKYPTSLANTTDGDLSTSAGTGTAVISAAGTIGKIEFNMGRTVRALCGVYAGIYSSAGTGRILIEAYATSGNIPDAETISITRTSTTEVKTSALPKILEGQYIVVRFWGSAAGTFNFNIYSVWAYEMG